MKEIKFTTTKNGQERAYSYSRQQRRWFPMAVDTAKILIATGQARLSGM